MENSLRKALAANLKERRKLHRFSQAQLAELANISSGYVGEIEIGRKFPTPEILQRLAEALDVSPYRLLMTRDDLKKEAGLASRQQAYDVIRRVRDTIDEEIRELAEPSPPKEDESTKPKDAWEMI